jgi:hypothetical protein
MSIDTKKYEAITPPASAGELVVANQFGITVQQLRGGEVQHAQALAARFDTAILSAERRGDERARSVPSARVVQVADEVDGLRSAITDVELSITAIANDNQSATTKIALTSLARMLEVTERRMFNVESTLRKPERCIKMSGGITKKEIAQ